MNSFDQEIGWYIIGLPLNKIRNRFNYFPRDHFKISNDHQIFDQMCNGIGIKCDEEFK